MFKMKHTRLSGILACTLLLATAGCSQEGLRHARGVVAEVEQQGDSLTGMRVVADGDTLRLSLAEARFTDGIALQGDSVSVHYGETADGSLLAYVVAVLPKAVVEVVAPDTLVTVPAAGRDSIE